MDWSTKKYFFPQPVLAKKSKNIKNFNLKNVFELLSRQWWEELGIVTIIFGKPNTYTWFHIIVRRAFGSIHMGFLHKNHVNVPDAMLILIHFISHSLVLWRRGLEGSIPACYPEIVGSRPIKVRFFSSIFLFLNDVEKSHLKSLLAPKCTQLAVDLINLWFQAKMGLIVW